jgi:hypothetical protein
MIFLESFFQSRISKKLSLKQHLQKFFIPKRNNLMKGYPRRLAPQRPKLYFEMAPEDMGNVLS